MAILLLTLLAIALTVTFAGMFLSPRSQQPQSRGVPYAPRSSGVRRVGATSSRQMRVQYSQTRMERRSWENTFAPTTLRRLFNPRPGDHTSWLGVVVVLVALFFFGFMSLRTILPDSAMILAASWPDATLANASNNTAAVAAPKNPATQPFSSLAGASKALIRLPQLDRAQYASNQEHAMWANSACSAASMTEVINAYGHHYRITDILKVEAGLHEITPELGLLRGAEGIQNTVAQFGFQTTTMTGKPLDEIIKVANDGRPVIIGFPPERWDGGHLLVLIGGDRSNVYLADSSGLDMKKMDRQRFLRFWVGFAVVATPK